MDQVGKSIYCATPSRLRHLKEEIKNVARKLGYVVPFHPADICPYEEFEKNPDFGREKTLELFRSFQIGFDVFGVCGVSEGVIGEWRNALAHSQPIRIFKQFDWEWNKYFTELAPVYFGSTTHHRTFAFVGPRAVGKTFYINFLLDRYPDYFERVKNTTTRKPREEADKLGYEIVSHEDFKSGIVRNQFFEFDEYDGNYYGSSRPRILDTLQRKNGIFALTPKGALALYGHRFDINFCPIVLKPKTEDVLRQNIVRRGITDPKAIENILQTAPDFILPDYVRHHVFEVTGTDADYEPFLKLIEPLMYAHQG